MHPLTGDLTKLTDEELVLKITDLSKRMNQAYRMGYGDALQQIQMFLYDYQTEQKRRNDILLAELTEKSNAFKGIIDIN